MYALFWEPLLFYFIFCMMKQNRCSIQKRKGRSKMTIIPEDDRNIMEKAIYLPMVLIVLNRDYSIVEKSPFKLKKPYLELIEETMKGIQSELSEVKQYMKKNKL